MLPVYPEHLILPEACSWKAATTAYKRISLSLSLLRVQVCGGGGTVRAGRAAERRRETVRVRTLTLRPACTHTRTQRTPTKGF